MSIVHRQFFGDADRDFALTIPMIEELQRLAGAGILAIWTRIRTSTASLSDLHQTIRLALIGGGTDPQEAAALMAAYIHLRPIEEAVTLAFVVMMTAMHGTASDEEAA